MSTMFIIHETNCSNQKIFNFKKINGLYELVLRFSLENFSEKQIFRRFSAKKAKL